MSKLPGINRNSINFRKLAAYALLNQDNETVKFVQKFGQNTDVDTAAAEDIWATGGNRSYLTSAETINIKSTSVNDTSGGTGARTVVVSGIDENYEEILDFIFLNGTTNVLTTNAYLDVFRVVVYQAGSLEGNDGDITATSSGTSTPLAEVPEGDGITQMSHYTIPAGYTAFLLTETLSAYKADGSGTRQAEIDFMVKGVGDSAWVKSAVRGVNSDTVTKNWDIPLTIPEKTRIKYRAAAASNNTSVSVQYEVLLIKNTELL